MNVAMLAFAAPSILLLLMRRLGAATARLRVVAGVDDVKVGKGQCRKGEEGTRSDGDGDESDVESVLDCEEGHDLPSRVGDA